MDESAVLDACDRLVDFHAWDAHKIDARSWMNNFNQAERRLAAELLSRFSFYADPLVDQLFRASFQSLSNIIVPDWQDFATAAARWSNFCQSALITTVEGELPNASDSGGMFVRKARQVLSISEEQLAWPGEAIQRLVDGHAGPVIFVDDFVGSGEQFLKTWTRKYKTTSGPMSFKTISPNSNTAFFYCNGMTTEYGRGRIAAKAPSVVVAAGNSIPHRHSLSSKQSVLWPKAMLNEATSFIREVSHRLGYIDDHGSEDDWEGFHKLGLGLAFAHSTPDATLPIFHTERKGWTPLVRRT